MSAFVFPCSQMNALAPSYAAAESSEKSRCSILRDDMAAEKTFFLETFGCQMNAHDSEKVIGTLQHQGYRQVQSEEEAGLILYNTCSIRDKAEQKVFNRLNDYKKLHKAGKRFGVLGCVAQQEGEKIFERAPYVSLVSGSASYRKLPEMLARLESGETRITGLDDRQTEETFETEFTARQNPYRGYITIIEGCDKFCSYCVVPYTRGKERSRASSSVLAEARRIADQGYTEIQLLGQNVNSYRDPEGNSSFAELLAAVGQIPGIRRVRFTTSHPRDFTRDIVAAIDSVPTLCDHVHLPVQSGSTRVLKLMAREYTREWYLERIGWIKAAKRPISLSTDIIVGFPGETPDDFIQTMDLLQEVGYDCVFGFKYSARPNTPALTMIDSIPEGEKATRLQVLLDRQREIQRVNYSKHIGQVMEVMVENPNSARGQISGRSSQNKPVNFTCTQPIAPAPGSYRQVRITAAFPNSLLGEAV
jgi:tRNA-2-methylthio-N6-dimethylallyladenosine synthase